MRIRLLKRWSLNKNISYPMGQIVPCDNGLAKKLIADKTGIEYTGPWPPTKNSKKMKTDFFKPKNNGSINR